MDALLRHYSFVTEFMWRVVEPSEEGSSIYVIDLEGLSMLDFVGDAVSFVRRAVRSTSLHYPERAGCVYVVNAPSWFGAIWTVVKPLLDEVTLKKIWVLRRGEDVFAALRVRISEDMIPPEYGGGSMGLGYSPEEKMLYDQVMYNTYCEEAGDRVVSSGMPPNH